LTNKQELQKPQSVLYAERALWGWTAWACLFGIYQSWLGIPEMENAISEQIPGLFTATPQSLLQMIIVGYVATAAVSVWFVLKIGAGKHWARNSLLWGFVLEIVWTACPPYHAALDYVADIPDLGFQIYALCLLYTQPGRDWFVQAAPVRTGS
jgi:hypothetical protein